MTDGSGPTSGMIARAFLTYCLSVLIVTGIQTVGGLEDAIAEGGILLASLFFCGTALGIGLLAAMPAAITWVVMWSLLGIFNLDVRLRAVIGAGLSAFVAAWSTGYFMQQFSGGFGQASEMPTPYDLVVIVFVGAAVAFAIWTLSSPKKEAKRG